VRSGGELLLTVCSSKLLIQLTAMNELLVMVISENM
jgi:hypothetical protein